MEQTHLPTPPKSPSIEPINSSLTLLKNLTTFYQQERHWVHCACAALESTVASTTKGTITPSADINDVSSNFSCWSRSTPSTLSSTASFLDYSYYPSANAEPFYSSMKTMDLQQRRNRKKNNPRLRLSGIAPFILKQQATRPSRRILEMFAELIESRMESCECVSNMIERYHRDRDF